jgi:hypothetical protein
MSYAVTAETHGKNEGGYLGGTPYLLSLVEPTQVPVFIQSGRRDSNSRPSAWEADTLPLSYARRGDAC